ncbi:MAG: hypothetical protein ABWY54_06785 [Glaciihabitans sp.]
MITIDLWFVLQLLAAGLAVWDAILRLRGKRGASALAIAELVLGGLLLLSLFTTLPAIIAQFPIALLLLIVLLLLIFLRGRRGRGGAPTLTIIAAVLTAVVVLVRVGWLDLPGI